MLDLENLVVVNKKHQKRKFIQFLKFFQNNFNYSLKSLTRFVIFRYFSFAETKSNVLKELRNYSNTASGREFHTICKPLKDGILASQSTELDQKQVAQHLVKNTLSISGGVLTFFQLISIFRLSSSDKINKKSK